MADSLPAPVRAIVPKHCRHFVGFDTVTVTPADKEGHCCIQVMKLIPSRIVGLYPAKDYSALGVAFALFKFFTTYDITDVFISAPGANITASVTRLFGVRLRLSLTDRHESNMTERSHQEMLRFLSALVHEERLIDSWGSVQNIKLVQFTMNDEVSAETMLSPFHYFFVTVDAAYVKLPALMSDAASANAFVQSLDNNLRILRDAAAKHQTARKAKRIEDNLAVPAQYQICNFVLAMSDSSRFKPSKLYPRNLGPYEVISSYKFVYMGS